MAGFIEELLSGKYPRLESVYLKDAFSKIVDEVFGKPKGTVRDGEEVSGLEDEWDEHLDEWEPEETMADDLVSKADFDRLEALLAEEKARHESLKRQMAVLKAERSALQYKLDAVRHALSHGGGLHPEPIG